MTTSSAASDENLVKMTTFSFQWTRQLSCHVMYKIVTCLDNYFSCRNHLCFYEIWIMSSWTLCATCPCPPPYLHIGANQVAISYWCLKGSGAHFNKDFHILIEIRWKFYIDLIHILMWWSLQNFAHDTTTLLSCHVQKFAVEWVQELELPSNGNDWQIFSDMDPMVAWILSAMTDG